jgi:probable F420-dependent oxidoreductase
MPGLQRGATAWRESLQRIEDRGFDEVAISEHYSLGWAMEPLTALAFAAASSTRLRILTLVLNNDVRHPALLAKAMATADVLSEGRVTLGIGAGWLSDDYRALGIPFDSAGVRLARLEEAIGIIRAFFTGTTFSSHANFYDVEALEAVPSPSQVGGPPILVGAGGPRMLDLAGRVADIAGIHVTLGPHGFDEAAAREMSESSILSKIQRVRAAADAAGRPTPIFEFRPVIVEIDGERSTGVRPGFTDYIEGHPTEFADSPAVLVGTSRQVAESIIRWTHELGIELWHLGADTEAVGRVISHARG